MRAGVVSEAQPQDPSIYPHDTRYSYHTAAHCTYIDDGADLKIARLSRVLGLKGVTSCVILLIYNTWYDAWKLYWQVVHVRATCPMIFFGQTKELYSG